jgi:hypothetical protein
MRPFKATWLFGVVLLATSIPAHAFDIPAVRYPSLPKQAASAEGFVPAGWTLEKQISGDLNGDGIADLTLLLRQNDPRNIVTHTILGENPLDTNPRILAVVFGRAAPAGFVLALENHTLIPRREVPAVSDPLEEGFVKAERGVLRVKLHYWSSAGSWGTHSNEFTFRYQNRRFELIGYNRSEFMRNTGESRDISMNLSTGRMSITTTSTKDDKSKVLWRTLPRQPLFTMDEIGNGFEYGPPEK